MGNKLTQLAHEAIQLELNVAKLYIIFRDICPDDSEFWWQLVIEENNHAALIRSGVDFFMEAGLFPKEILPPIISDLQQANDKLIALLEKHDKTLPSREEAFNIALKMERSAGEIHYQRLMTKSADSRMIELFQKLNEDDNNHIERIQAYMKDHGLKELP